MTVRGWWRRDELYPLDDVFRVGVRRIRTPAAQHGTHGRDHGAAANGRIEGKCGLDCKENETPRLPVIYTSVAQNPVKTDTSVFTTHCQRDSAPRSTRSPTAHLHARLSQTLRVPPSARRGVHAVRPCRDPLTSRPSRSPADGAYSALTAAALTAAASPQPPPHRKRKNIFLTTRASTETLHLAASTGLSG